MSYQFQRFGMFVLMIIGLSACSSSHSSEPITVVSLKFKYNDIFTHYNCNLTCS